MATTTILTIHINKGKTPKQCVAAQLNYIMNPTKTNGGALISSHACMPETAVNEFMLYRQKYFENTGREIDNEVLVYHVRQAFKPDEITPEEANEIGKELASRMTNDQFAYVVATHIDKHHVHNHIVICSTALDCQHKYRDVKRSGKDLAQLSDEICEEHQLSVIRDPQNKTVSYDKWQGNQRRFTHRDELRMIIDAALRMQSDGFDALMQLLEDAGCRIKRGAQISIKLPKGKRYIRLDTGMRAGELLGLTWDNVDFDHGVIHIVKQLTQSRGEGHPFAFGTLKNGKTRSINPAPFVLETLKAHKEYQEEQKRIAGDLWNEGKFPNLVFTHADGSHLSQPTIWKAFQKALEDAGLDHHRLHDCRHTFAVNSIRAGDDIKTIQENMGHYSAAFTLDRYGHVTETMRQESANRMQAFIQGMSGNGGGNS